MRWLLIAAIIFSGCVHTGMRFIDGPQGKLHVDDGGSGSGVPVLFVHGNGASLTQWRYQLAHLRPSRRVVAMDLRAMGDSEIPRNGDYSVNAMADDVAAVADALRLPRFVIVGHSFGGAVVTAYAAKHPERLAGVVLVDAAGNVKVAPDAAANFLESLRKDKNKVARQWFAPILENASDAVKEEVFASVAKTPDEAFVQALNGMLSFDAVAAANAYHGPRLAIVPAKVNPGSLHAQVPMRVETIEGVSHWLMLDKPDEFNRILDGFLAEIDRSNPSR